MPIYICFQYSAKSQRHLSASRGFKVGRLPVGQVARPLPSARPMAIPKERWRVACRKPIGCDFVNAPWFCPRPYRMSQACACFICTDMLFCARRSSTYDEQRARARCAAAVQVSCCTCVCMHARHCAMLPMSVAYEVGLSLLPSGSMLSLL